MAVDYDEIGIWSEVKLAIVREYARTYSTIMEAWRRDNIRRLSWIYIDAYAGPGYHLSKTTGETVEGSPLIALNTNPPFHEYHFIDTEPARAKQLRELAGDRPDVHTYTEDCNTVLLRDVFPRAKYADYRRALCLLDPYNINLTWEVIGVRPTDLLGAGGHQEENRRSALSDLSFQRSVLLGRVEPSVATMVSARLEGNLEGAPKTCHM